MKRFCAFFLTLITLFLVGCSGGGQGSAIGKTTDDTDPPGTSVTSSIPLIGEDGTPVYRVTRAEIASDEVVQAAVKVNQSLKTMSGKSFTLTTDFLKRGDSADEVYEILVGDTNRALPKEYNALATDEYRIAVTEYKIFIQGGSGPALSAGVDAFLTMLSGERCTLALSYGNSVQEKIEVKPYLIGVTNQGQSKVEVYDVSRGVLNVETKYWSYDMPYYNIADVKLRENETYGQVMLAVCGGSYACMVSYPEGKLLWKTNVAANNPHSIELIPGEGVIAVASSTGNAIRFFDAAAQNASVYTEVPMTDAHGVLWDPTNKVLWALGRDVQTAYTVKKNADGKAEVSEVKEMRATVPTDYGHDLAPVYGNADRLWITTGAAVYQYDKKTGKFYTDYAGSSLINRKNVKSIGNFPDGSVILTYPDGHFQTWNTQTISFFAKQSGSEKFLTAPSKSKSGDFYKSRVWIADYQ